MDGRPAFSAADQTEGKSRLPPVNETVARTWKKHPDNPANQPRPRVNQCYARVNRAYAHVSRTFCRVNRIYDHVSHIFWSVNRKFSSVWRGCANASNPYAIAHPPCPRVNRPLDRVNLPSKAAPSPFLPVSRASYRVNGMDGRGRARRVPTGKNPLARWFGFGILFPSAKPTTPFEER